MVRVAVVGAGAVGLMSAINVQRAVPGAHVTVIADKFGSDTTSHGAGGFFRPFMPDIAKGVDPAVAEQWVRDSWQFYSGLAAGPQAAESGQTFVHGVAVYNTPQDEGYEVLKSLVPDFRAMPFEELQKRKLDRYKYGYAFTTVVSQTPKFLGWLMKIFKREGGKFERSTVTNLTSLAQSYDVVVNCCGLRANEITQDTGCFPIKGHLVLVRAPWQKQFFFAVDNIYLIPHDNKLIIGGLREKGDYSLSADPQVSQRIRARAEELFPQLKGAEHLGEWVGLRPGRDPGVRLEMEALDCGQGRTLQVVHNYGHAGHGITLAWGCGSHAARLVRLALQGHQSRL